MPQLSYSCEHIMPGVSFPLHCIGYNLVAAQSTSGDDMLQELAQCDDNNTVDFDGCTNHTIDFMFECTENAVRVSECEAILLDLNTPDSTTLGYSAEFFDTNTFFFLSNPNVTSFIRTHFGGVSFSPLSTISG